MMKRDKHGEKGKKGDKRVRDTILSSWRSSFKRMGALEG